MVGQTPGETKLMTLTQAANPERELNTCALGLIEDPYAWYAQMRAERVVPYMLPGRPNARAVMLSRHADVQTVLRDPRFGRLGFRQAAASALGEGPLLDSYAHWFLFQG